jgi:hypothetical protein
MACAITSLILFAAIGVLAVGFTALCGLKETSSGSRRQGPEWLPRSGDRLTPPKPPVLARPGPGEDRRKSLAGQIRRSAIGRLVASGHVAHAPCPSPSMPSTPENFTTLAGRYRSGRRPLCWSLCRPSTVPQIADRAARRQECSSRRVLMQGAR